MAKIKTGSKRVVANYDPSQARDEHGRWAAEGNAAMAAAKAESYEGSANRAVESTTRRGLWLLAKNQHQKAAGFYSDAANEHQAAGNHAQAAEFATKAQHHSERAAKIGTPVSGGASAAPKRSGRLTRKVKDDIYGSLGMKRVKGSGGGTYYE